MLDLTAPQDLAAVSVLDSRVAARGYQSCYVKAIDRLVCTASHCGSTTVAIVVLPLDIGVLTTATALAIAVSANGTRSMYELGGKLRNFRVL